MPVANVVVINLLHVAAKTLTPNRTPAVLTFPKVPESVIPDDNTQYESKAHPYSSTDYCTYDGTYRLPYNAMKYHDHAFRVSHTGFGRNINGGFYRRWIIRTSFDSCQALQRLVWFRLQSKTPFLSACISMYWRTSTHSIWNSISYFYKHFHLALVLLRYYSGRSRT